MNCAPRCSRCLGETTIECDTHKALDYVVYFCPDISCVMFAVLRVRPKPDEVQGIGNLGGKKDE